MTAVPLVPQQHWWFSVPQPISAGPLMLLPDGHIGVNGQRWIGAGANWTNYSIFGVLQGQKNVCSGFNVQQQALTARHIANMKAGNYNFARAHGFDLGSGLNIFCSMNGPATQNGQVAQSMQCDPWSLQAFDWWVNTCRSNGIRVGLTMHYNRVLQAADVVGAGPEVQELMNYAYIGSVGKGGVWPWKAVFDSVRAFDVPIENQILGYASHYDSQNRTLGELIDIIWIENEHSLGREQPHGWLNLPTPQLQAGFNALWLPWCVANNISPATASQSVFAQFGAYLDCRLANFAIARLRPLTTALLATGTFFGDSPYASVPGCQCGDISDGHGYSRWTAGQPNCFAPAPGAARSVAGAMLAGLSGINPRTGQPFAQGWSEVGPQGQYGGGVMDPPNELIADAGNVVAVAEAQDIDYRCDYAYANGAVQPDGSTLPAGVYDLDTVAGWMKGMASHNAHFCDPDNRSTDPPITVAPTNGLYGSGVPTVQYGPTNDPALLAIDPTKRVLLTLG
jgi:hypothetical protein